MAKTIIKGMIVVHLPVGETSGICCDLARGKRGVSMRFKGGFDMIPQVQACRRLWRVRVACCAPFTGEHTYLNQRREKKEEVRIATELLKEELCEERRQRVLCRAGEQSRECVTGACEAVDETYSVGV
jgi:hypothetical protein